ncbi:MAG: DUF92 domain-containing protein, partial [Gemmatimonadota bacterium]
RARRRARRRRRRYLVHGYRTAERGAAAAHHDRRARAAGNLGRRDDAGLARGRPRRGAHRGGRSVVRPRAAGGIAGGVADSLLGATLQARYRCAACGAPGEQPMHWCGGTGILVRGMRWITNDTVNLLATAVGAAVAAAPVALRVAGLA